MECLTDHQQPFRKKKGGGGGGRNKVEGAGKRKSREIPFKAVVPSPVELGHSAFL